MGKGVVFSPETHGDKPGGSKGRDSMPMIKSEGLDVEENNWLVTLPRAWGEADTLDVALENAKDAMDVSGFDDSDTFKASVFLITPETDATIVNRTGAVHLEDNKEVIQPHNHDELPREEVNDKELEVNENGDHLEYVTTLTVRATSRPESEL